MDVSGTILVAMVTVLVLMVLKSALLPSACSPQVCAFGAPAHREAGRFRGAAKYAA